MKASLCTALCLISSASLAASEEAKKPFRFSIGAGQNIAAVDAGSMSLNRGSDTTTYETGSFSAISFTGDYKTKLNRNWLNLNWYWEAALSGSLENNSIVETGTCLAKSEYFDDYYDVSCDIRLNEKAHHINTSILSKFNLTNNSYILLGGGFGVYRLTRTLEVEASGYKTKELTSKSTTNVLPQLKLSVGVKSIELAYTFAPGFGNSSMGVGDYHQINLSYGAWQNK